MGLYIRIVKMKETMKRIVKSILMILLVLWVALPTQAQKIDVKKKVKKEAHGRADSRTDQAIDRSFDRVEEGIGKLFQKNEKKDSGASKKKNDEEDEKPVSKKESKSKDEEPAVTSNMNLSETFDFKPGANLIFEDLLKTEMGGEFPSNWDINKGTVEVADLGKEKAIYFKKTSSSSREGVVPLVTNRKDDYLPDAFTLEFDFYAAADAKQNAPYNVFLFDAKNQKQQADIIKAIEIQPHRVVFDGNQGICPGADASKPKEGWHRVSILFENNTLSLYVDKKHVLQVPDCTFNPSGLTISAHNYNGNALSMVKNVRLASK
jgi:OmpA-OmpF porin, OOP family